MTIMAPEYESVVKMSYGYFGDRICTAESLGKFLDLMKPMLDAAGVSRETAYADLERRHTIAILDPAFVLEDHSNHEDWLNPSTNDGLQRHVEWHFWEHFEAYLTAGKNWPKAVVESIDRESTAVLSRLEDPHRPGKWDRRGMVMGSVQSGKTSNYTGLICKAIDAGYRLIVVLAGVHNSLRSQTQYRLNEEVLGYDLDKVQEFRGQAARIGVRAMFSDHKVVQTLTSSSENGDFKKAVADQAGVIPSADGSPIIMVIKKHVSILKNLNDWATSIIGHQDGSGRRIVNDVPLLLIDDECDYASVNTKKVVLSEDGVVNEECDPAKTNLRIRELLNAFTKSAYIGYTATPFANIFIHHDTKHPKYGEDIFPRNFIISLPQPNNYVGAERVFGLVQHSVAGIDERGPADLVRHVDDSDELIPAQHKRDLTIEVLPASLQEAVRAFLLSCAARRLRQAAPPHNSMLVHVTRFTDVQARVHVMVERLLRGYVDRIRSGSDCLSDFRDLWEENFVPTTEGMSDEVGAVVHGWTEIADCLYLVARRVRVTLINGTSSDSLAYRHAELAARQRIERGEAVPWEERGEHVIAIGGDKLSRGLTLDGLTVSYYLRAAKMYDTLMQMGRWFGYRDGYMDLCRIYTTKELAEWYQFIASSSAELRQELEYMALINAEPKEFGLKVLDHPGQLAITSAGKRRNAEVLDLSYSGRISETVVFDLKYSIENLKALETLLADIAADETATPHSDGLLHWTNVGPDVVIRYLGSYRTHDDAARVVDPKKIALFIRSQLKHGDGDLTEWDVAIISRQARQYHSVRLRIGKEVHCLERRPMRLGQGTLAIGRLVNPSDEWLDFDEEERRAAWSRWSELRLRNGNEPPEQGALPSGPAIRAARPKSRGLLLVYPICYVDQNDTVGGYGTEPGREVTGFAVSFPASDTTQQVRYEVNSVFQHSES